MILSGEINDFEFVLRVFLNNFCKLPKQKRGMVLDIVSASRMNTDVLPLTQFLSVCSLNQIQRKYLTE